MEEATCSKCGVTKDLEEFYRGSTKANGRKSRCKSCSREDHRRWSETNREAKNAYQREYVRRNREDINARKRTPRYRELEKLSQRGRRERTRQRVIRHFGGKCAGCGVAERLVLDHVNDDGAKHRQEGGLSGSSLYSHLAANNFDTDGYELQLLCPNCHFDKTWPTRAPANSPMR